jgi:hypothetical protein
MRACAAARGALQEGPDAPATSSGSTIRVLAQKSLVQLDRARLKHTCAPPSPLDAGAKRPLNDFSHVMFGGLTHTRR